MLVEEMTVTEIHKAIFYDFDKIRKSSTQTRLQQQYYDKRKELKINKQLSYPLFFAFKSKTKNNWLLLIHKKPIAESVKSVNDITSKYITYYHTHKGFRVFVPCLEKELLVYNGHLFTRYRERMNLNVTDPFEIIKQFFTNNCNQPVLREFEPNEVGDIPVIFMVKEGYLMGDIQKFTDQINWHVLKTFIPNNTATFKHVDISTEAKLIAAKNLLSLKLGTIKELDAVSKNCCDLLGFVDKEVTIPFLEHIIAECEKGEG